MRTVSLFIPSLFWPDTGDQDPYATLRLPALETLLAWGSATDVECENETAWLCRRFAVHKQDDWPVAPLAFAGEGGESDEGYWLRADPVHLRVRNDGLILQAPETLQITWDECRELVTALNHEFEAEEFVFHAPHPHRWYLKMPRAPRIRTVTLKQAIGRDINHLLPEGDARLRWHGLINEMQMLMHAHPANVAREERGAVVLNSLWLWGGGTMPAVSSAVDAVQSDDPLSVGLARRAGIVSAPLPVGGGLASGNDTLVDLRDAEREYMRGDVAGWRHALETLEALWFAPLSERLRTRTIDRVVIATVADGRQREWSIVRRARWWIWKKTKPLAYYPRNALRQREPARFT